MKSKKELRKEILALRDSLSLEERREKSRQIVEQVVHHEKFLEADKVFLFASFGSEVDTTDILKVALQMGKEVYFPKVEGKEMVFYEVEQASDLIEGYRGIREPKTDEKKRFAILPRVYHGVNLNTLQTEELSMSILVIMPGVVFDRMGNRIGYGGGYYDKFLQRLEANERIENLFKLAIAFECQLVENGRITREEYDISPQLIVTESSQTLTIEGKMK